MPYGDHLFDLFIPWQDFGLCMDHASGEYCLGWEQYWGVNASSPPEHLEMEEWNEYVRYYHLILKLAKGAQSLVRPGSIPEKDLSLPHIIAEEAKSADKSISELEQHFKENIVSSDWWKIWDWLLPVSPHDPRTKLIFFQTCMQIEADRMFNTDPAILSDRMYVLLGYLSRTKSEKINSYLSRVASCYIRNMIPEMAVMTRAVLDTAIRSLFTDDFVKDSVGLEQNHPVVLERRIQCCYQEDVFDDAAKNAADNIREQGKHAAHIMPESLTEAEELLENLFQCLQAIETWRERNL